MDSPQVFSSEWWANLGGTVLNWISTAGIKLVIGLIVLFISFKLVNLFAKGIRKTMIRRGVEKTIYTVTYSVIRKALKFLLFLLLLAYVGIETAGIGTIIASAGVAIGLALQGSLSNLAGGMIILVTHPFRIGDYISAQEQSGTVEDIHIFYTVLVTPDNIVIHLPNGTLSNGSIVNYSQKELRRLDLRFTIGYGENFLRAEEAVLDVLKSFEEILDTVRGAPADPFVKMIGYKENSVEIVSRAWTRNADYWFIYFRVLEGVKAKFDAEGIAVPYPQMDVHVNNAPAPINSDELTVREKDGKTRIQKRLKRGYETDRAAKLAAEEEANNPPPEPRAFTFLQREKTGKKSRKNADKSSKRPLKEQIIALSPNGQAADAEQAEDTEQTKQTEKPER